MNMIQNVIAKQDFAAESVKEITNDLLTMRKIASVEKLRILMLPENETMILIANDNCSLCSKLKKIQDSVESLLACSQNKHFVDGDDDVEKDAACIDPLEYKTTLIKLNDNLNFEMRNLYISVRENDSHLKTLTIYKYIQENVDTLIMKISNEDDKENIKRKTNKILSTVFSETKRRIEDCEQNCDSLSCSSCAAMIIDNTVEQVKSHQLTLIVQEDLESAKEIIQKGLINFIQKITEDCDKIFVRKI